jgi:hypothetical protein
MDWGFLVGVIASVGLSGLFAFCTGYPHISDIGIVAATHLPGVEGVSEALVQQCIGASVFQVCITRPPLAHRTLPHRYLRQQS